MINENAICRLSRYLRVVTPEKNIDTSTRTNIIIIINTTTMIN